MVYSGLALHHLCCYILFVAAHLYNPALEKHLLELDPFQELVVDCQGTVLCYNSVVDRLAIQVDHSVRLAMSVLGHQTCGSQMSHQVEPYRIVTEVEDPVGSKLFDLDILGVGDNLSETARWTVPRLDVAALFFDQPAIRKKAARLFRDFDVGNHL